MVLPSLLFPLGEPHSRDESCTVEEPHGRAPCPGGGQRYTTEPHDLGHGDQSAFDPCRRPEDVLRPPELGFRV